MLLGGATDLLRVIPAAKFVGIGRRFIGVEEHVAVRCVLAEMYSRRGHPTRSHLSYSRSQVSHSRQAGTCEWA